MFTPNDKVGPYILIRFLGRGTFGEVWLGEKQSKYASTQFALKFPVQSGVDSEAIKQEALMWVKASGHPNVLPIFEADEYDGYIVIVSELALDGSLDDWLNRNEGKAPSIDIAVKMMDGILAGLEHLHARRIIHRDLKPANILLQGNMPRLADFGIARVLKTTQITNTQAGTPLYMSPEAWKRERTEQTDLWAAAVIFYQLLSGDTPFEGEDFPSLMFSILHEDAKPLPDWIPKSLKDFVATALNKKAPERYQTASTMREGLHETNRRLLEAANQRTLVDQRMALGLDEETLGWENAGRQNQKEDQSHKEEAERLRQLLKQHESRAREDAQKRKELEEELSKARLANDSRKESQDQNRASMLPSQYEQKTPAPPSKGYSQTQREELSPNIHLPAAQTGHEAPSPSLSWPVRSEQVLPAPRSKKALWITIGSILLLVVIALAVVAVKQITKSSDRQPPIAKTLVDARTYAVQGDTLVSNNQIAEAESAYREAIAKAPDNAYYRLKLAYALSVQRKTEEYESECKEAERLAREGLRLEPDSAANHYYLGKALTFQEKLADGEAEMKEAIRLNANEHEYHHDLGFFNLQLQEKYKNAEEKIREAIRLNPDYFDYYDSLGQILTSQEKYADAEAALKEAIRLNPSPSWIHRHLGDVLIQQKKCKEALDAYTEAIKLEPDEARSHYALGNVLFMQGEYAKAEEEYRKAVHLYPNEPAYRESLGDFLSNRKRLNDAKSEYKEAESRYKEMVSLNPERPSYHYNLGAFLYNRKRYKEAEPSLKKVIALSPDQPAYHYNLAKFLHNQNRYKEAVSEYNEAIRLRSDAPGYHSGLGAALYSLKQYPAAEDAMKQAISLKPDGSSYQNALGVILAGRKNYQEAELAWREAIRLEPDKPLYYNNLGFALQKQNKHTEAQAEFKKAKSLEAKQGKEQTAGLSVA